MITQVSGTEHLPFNVDISYYHDNLDKLKIANILHLDTIDTWTICDRQDNLVMIHYKEEADMMLYGHLRGVVVDLATDTVVVDSYGFSPIAVAPQLTPVDDHLTLIDTEGHYFHWKMSEVTIRRSFEGVMLRVIWYNNTCYRLTHRKIKSEKCNWGSSKTFLKMYQEAGGPEPSQLFDCTRPYSSTCYDFLVVDPTLIAATRQRVEKPYLVFLGARELHLSVSLDQITAGVPNFVFTDKVEATVKESFIHHPQPLTIEEANEHLRSGYYPRLSLPSDMDQRQAPGECLTIHHYVDGLLDRVIKVHSFSYHWRYIMHGNETNISYRFYCMLKWVYPLLNCDADWDRLRSYFPVMSLYSESSLQYLHDTRGGILTLPSAGIEVELLKRHERVRLLWCNFVLSMPLHLQPKGIKLFKEYCDGQEELVPWICAVGQGEVTIVKSKKKPFNSIPRVLTVYRLAYQSAAQDESTINDHRRLHEAAKANIISMVGKEYGPSLYAMVNDMRIYRQNKK